MNFEVLNGVRMRPVRMSAESALSAESEFAFRQRGRMFSASYRGGAILDGYLIGRLQPSWRLEFRYVQADAQGNLDAGVSTGVLSRSTDGRLQLIEDFHWITRPQSGQNVLEEI